MSRVQKSICDHCGKETTTKECFAVDGFNVRIADHTPLSYLHSEDFCSIECLMKALDKVLSSLNKQMNDNKKQLKAQGKRK